MITAEQKRALIGFFRSAGVGWYFTPYVEEHALAVVRDMATTSRIIRRKSGADADVFSEMTAEPDGFAPLIQSFAAPMTNEIRAMVYCVVRGARVVSLDYRYRVRRSSSLQVSVEFANGGLADFKSSDLWDAEVLHHFGFAKIGGKPFIDAYLPFRT